MKLYNYLILAVAMLLLIGCSSATEISSHKEPIKIGVMTITTGDIGFLGQNLLTSIDVALEDLGRDDVQIILEDVSFGDGAKAVSAYRKLVDVEGVEVIINLMSVDNTLAVASLLENDQVVMLIPGTSGSSADAASNYLFRNGPSDILAGIDMAKDFNERDINNIALFTDNGAYTLDIRDRFLQGYEGNILVNELIDPLDDDFRTTLIKTKTKPIEAIVILSAAGKTGNGILKQMIELNINIPVYMNFFAYNEDTTKIDNILTKEIYVYIIDDKDTLRAQNFLEKFEQKAGKSPAYVFHQLNVYDEVRMILEATQNVGYDGTLIRNYLLENIQDWQGLSRKITFNEQGNDMTYGFTLAKMDEEGLTKV